MYRPGSKIVIVEGAEYIRFDSRMIGQLFPDFSSSVNSRECERAVPGGAVVAGFGLSLTFQALLLAVAQPAYTLERTTQRTQVSASPALRMAGSLCDRAGARAGAGPTVTRPQPHPCGRGSVEVCSASKRTPRETNRTRQSRGRKPAVKVVNHAGCWDKSRSEGLGRRLAQTCGLFRPLARPFVARAFLRAVSPCLATCPSRTPACPLGR